jgi:hypothetical protein
MLPADLRFSYFRDVPAEKMSAEQLKTLMILAPDDGCIAEAAGIALLLASSDDKQARDVSTLFFAGLSKTHSSLVLPYLRSCLVFLVQPPDHSPRILIELRGNAAVLCTILENLPDVETAVVPNFSMFVALIADAFQKPRATSYRFIFTFAVLAVLPKRFAGISGVKAAVDFALQYLRNNDPNKPPKMERRLLKNVMKFLARYPDPEQNHQLMSVIMTRSRLPFAMINALCHIIPQTTPDDSLAFPTTKFMLSFALQVKPSQRLIKSSIKRPLPIGTDLISYKKPVSKKQIKMDNFLRRFIESFPGLVNSCSPENQTELVNILMTTFSVTAVLIVTSLCGMPGKLPSNFCEYYLANFTCDSSLVQVIAECLVRYALKLSIVAGHSSNPFIQYICISGHERLERSIRNRRGTSTRGSLHFHEISQICIQIVGDRVKHHLKYDPLYLFESLLALDRISRDQFSNDRQLFNTSVFPRFVEPVAFY